MACAWPAAFLLSVVDPVRSMQHAAKHGAFMFWWRQQCCTHVTHKKQVTFPQTSFGSHQTSPTKRHAIIHLPTPTTFYQATNWTDLIPSTRNYIKIYKKSNHLIVIQTSQPTPNQKAWPTKQSWNFTVSWRVFWCFMNASDFCRCCTLATSHSLTSDERRAVEAEGMWRMETCQSGKRCRCGGETELVHDGSGIFSIQCFWYIYS